MWIHQRVGRNTAISTPVWPLILVGLFVIGLVIAFFQTLAQMPLSYWAWFAGAGLVMFVSYTVLAHRIQGVWPWQPLPLASQTDDDEDQPAQT